MKNNILIIAITVLALSVIGLMAVGSGGVDGDVSEHNGILATVYKSPTCGCCGVYASYLGKEGYEVDAQNVQNVEAVKEELGVPHELYSCHTAEIGGYVVEGHIPNEAIEKLLAEQPDIKGIGMPGMPAGSPGMPGPKTGQFVIYEITHDGAQGDVFMTI